MFWQYQHEHSQKNLWTATCVNAKAILPRAYLEVAVVATDVHVDVVCLQDRSDHLPVCTRHGAIVASAVVDASVVQPLQHSLPVVDVLFQGFRVDQHQVQRRLASLKDLWVPQVREVPARFQLGIFHLGPLVPTVVVVANGQVPVDVFQARVIVNVSKQGH